MHAAEAIISTEGCFNHIQPNASEGFAFKEARVLVAAKNSAKLYFFSRYSPGELTQHVLHRNIQHFIIRWKRGGLIHAFYLSLMALISFFYFFSKTKTTITGNIWCDGTKPEWPTLLPVLKRAFTSACLSVYLLNQWAQRVTGVWRNR